MTSSVDTTASLPPETKDFEDKKQPEKKLTREQKRFLERVEKEAAQVHRNLAEKFFNFFVDCDDPEGEETVNYMDQLCAQWKLYCHRKRLSPEAHGLLEQDCRLLINQYLSLKKEKEQNIIPSKDAEMPIVHRAETSEANENLVNQ